MALPPTDTVKIRDVLRRAQQRSRELSRTQQIQIGEDLYCRIAPGGSKFLLFSLDSEPDHATAEAVAQGLGFESPEYGWHQGETLRSLTVVDLAAEPEALPDALETEPQEPPLS
ncbi:hypothetical protein EHF33_11440 [Deinococcus psychrotolerans]|uniref:Uncharacterized protein n=1 Tax=Deinococcus psychrotolerans TaxID=2489213 RepID=A0A3G8YNV2_9DEIO|nr:hypothetical protein [Deinococcus psychrotolerans]AZI43281.1 hypothetical protein EHF33_11440 [Deinococcus psychrotolerans]